MAKEASEPTILYLVDEMEQDKLIKVVNTVKRVRGSKPSKYYDLSLHGLAGLIIFRGEKESDGQFLSELAKKYRDLMPSIFGIWPAIVEAGVEDIARERLDLLCNLLLSGQPVRRASYVEEDVLESDGILADDGADLLLDPLESSLDTCDGLALEPAKRWLNAARGNPSLRQASIGALRRIIEYYRVAADGIEKNLREATDLLARLEQAGKTENPM